MVIFWSKDQISLLLFFLSLCPEAQVNGACADEQEEQEEQRRPELVKPVEPAINEEHMACVTGVDEMFSSWHRVSWP